MPSAELVAIVKNEERYILEWIAYHRAIGFREITIYDNDSDDRTGAICSRLSEHGVISYRYWPNVNGQSAQVPAYQDAAKQSAADWICCLDADEFLWIRSGDLIRFIGAAGQSNMPIALSWKIFGSSNQESYSPELVLARFQYRGEAALDVNRHIKTLGPVSVLKAGAKIHVHGWVLADDQFYVNPTGHRVEIKGHTFLDPNWDEACVNHYIVKSKQEFDIKRSRGRASRSHSDPDRFSHNIQNYFNVYDRNEIYDPSMESFLEKVSSERERLGSLTR